MSRPVTDHAKLIAEAVERLSEACKPGSLRVTVRAADVRVLLTTHHLEFDRGWRAGVERGKAEASAAEVESVGTLCRVVIEAWQGRDTT
jgi:hypothetical protein